MVWPTGIPPKRECFSGENFPYQSVLLSSVCVTRFKLRLPSSQGTQGDSEALISTKALENGVLALPGTVFLPNGDRTAYVRASFSLLEEEKVDEALRRLAEVIRQGNL